MTEPRTQRSASAGFTLIELMVVMVVVAVGVLALSQVQTRSSRDVYSTGRGERALALAQQRIEITRSAGYTAAVSDSGVSDVFAWVARVDSAGLELKQVAVTVRWLEGTSPQSCQLNTLLSAR